MIRRAVLVLTVSSLAFLAVSPAQGGSKKAVACGVSPYSYAGLQSDDKAHGVAATLAPTRNPSVSNGHVGGWIGLGGTDAGPGGEAEWIQVGLAAFTADRASKMYYEVTVPGSQPRYVELAPSIAPGVAHHFAVLEMSQRKSWWRVWVDSKPVSPPIHLPGSHGAWYPQAVAENWNGGAGACNGYGYRFSNISLAHAAGGAWQPLDKTYTFEDPGCKVVPISSAPRAFLATSL